MRAPHPVILAVLLVTVTLPGCMEKRVVRESFAGLRAQADKPAQPGSRGGSLHSAAGAGWAIELADLEGDDRYFRAQKIFSQLNGHDLPPLWFQDVGPRTVVYCGRFSDPASPEAQFAMRSIASIERDGERPFKNARVKPLSQEVNIQIDPYDLRQYANFYTLEIATFSRQFTGDRKQAAEQLAHQMRDDGHDAYFYHGPHSSSVCIGLFDQADFVREGMTHVPGPRMRQVQEQYPTYRIDGKDAVEHAPPILDGQDPLPIPRKSYFVRVL